MTLRSDNTTAATQAPVAPSQTEPRSTRPVFVVGCPRSGTTMLYHMILSSGDFALFPYESDTFATLGAKFSDLSSLKSRKRLLEFYWRTKVFALSGLERSDIESEVLDDCRDIGNFLRIVMAALCRKQGMHRWAEKTPDHSLYIPQIKRLIPEALIVHIIRDGRDTALSFANFGRIQPFFWEATSKLLACGVYWKWIVRKGRKFGRRIGADYYELHYEDLAGRPRETLTKLGEFIEHDLNYDRILEAGVGSVNKPRTSFPSSNSGFNPVGRWQTQFPQGELAKFEALAGDCLEELGYSLATPPEQRRPTFSAAAISAFYSSQCELRQWLKTQPPFRRLVGRRRAL